MELDFDTRLRLAEVAEGLIVMYTEEKILKSKIPSKKQMIVETESIFINFISTCSIACLYTEERMMAYLEFMMSITLENLEDALDNIDFELNYKK